MRRTTVIIVLMAALALLVAGCGANANKVRTIYDEVARTAVEGCFAQAEGNSDALQRISRQYDRVFEEFKDEQHKGGGFNAAAPFSDDYEEVQESLTKAMGDYCPQQASR